MTVTINHPVPNFDVPTTQTPHLTQQALLGQFTIFYFYPKDNTPGCTTEGLDFMALYEDFKTLKAQIFGISKDSLKKHQNFREKHQFPFDLISDEAGQLCDLFEVFKLKKNYGREYMGIERSTFLIDPEGNLIFEWRKVRVKNHAQTVFETLKSYQEKK